MSSFPPSIRHVLLSDPHQVLLDDSLLARQSGLARRLGKIEKYSGNPILIATEPHEEMGVLMFGTLVFDEGRYRCWYMTHGRGDHFCYAESDDGVVWRKPLLGLVEWGGSRNNNILFSTCEGWSLANLSVAKSVNEENSGRRYRAVLFMYKKTNHRGPERGHYIVYSPDGVHWTLPEAAPNVNCNECGGLLWDETRTDFVDLNKTGHAVEMFNREDMRVGHTRCTAVATSDDGHIWSPYRVVLMPNLFFDEPFDEFYHLHGFRWGGSYIGYLRIYHNTPDCGNAPRQRIDIQLATSRDGETWQRVCPGENFIQSAKSRQWDFGRVAIGNGPPAVLGDTMRVYYCGQPTDHRGGDGLGGRGEMGLGKGYTAKVGFAVLRKDGFVSLDADGDGYLLTHPLLTGEKLHLNVDAARGSCRVELQSPDGRAIPGYSLDECMPLRTDQVDAEVTWKQGRDMPSKITSTVRLKIVLDKAKLYAFRWIHRR